MRRIIAVCLLTVTAGTETAYARGGHGQGHGSNWGERKYGGAHSGGSQSSRYSRGFDRRNGVNATPRDGAGASRPSFHSFELRGNIDPLQWPSWRSRARRLEVIQRSSTARPSPPPRSRR